MGRAQVSRDPYFNSLQGQSDRQKDLAVCTLKSVHAHTQACANLHTQPTVCSSQINMSGRGYRRRNGFLGHTLNLQTSRCQVQITHLRRAISGPHRTGGEGEGVQFLTSTSVNITLPCGQGESCVCSYSVCLFLFL